MANESRAFRMLPNVKLEDVVRCVETFCQVEKHMETQSSPTTEGFVLQASQPKDGWKTISGTRLAITVHFMLVSDVLTVTVGEGQWSDKIGAGAIGLFVAWPLAISAGFGVFKQKKLPAEIFAEIEKAIYTGGHQVVITGSGSVVQEGMVVCTQCKTQNAAGAKFCKNCGAALNSTCPDCGFSLAPGAHFCSGCGKKLD
ncbi:MAG: zinc ribbon domain-containing protein [Clostridia bacterium]|nr:zinc ribbon domain-containing protein [Clostridia bacterium]